MSVLCRVCRGATVKRGYLYICRTKSCGAAHWDKRAVLKKDLEDKKILNQVLANAGVPDHLKSNKSHYVYILRLRGKPEGLYVGMTGLHPYARYLNHIRGYKSSSVAKSRATALIEFVGPMTYEQATMREATLAEQLRIEGKTVYGGH